MAKNMRSYNYKSAIVLRAYYSGWQKRTIIKNDNAQRYIRNKCVAVDRELYELKKVRIYCEPVAKRIEFLESLKENASAIANTAPFLYEEGVDGQARSNAVYLYRKAWEQFRKIPGTGKPAFHKKGYAKRYQTNAHYGKCDTENLLFKGSACFLDRNHVKLPVLGRVRVKGSPKRVESLLSMKSARIGTVTVFIDECGDGFVIFQLAADEPFAKPFPKTGGMLGIDVNIENLYADSNGNIVGNPKYRSSMKDRLAREQWKLSRKMTAAKREGRDIRSSKKLQEQRVKVAKINRLLRRRSDDYSHVCSKNIVESQDLVFAEDLKVKNLLKNHSLAFSISDVSWGKFMRDIEYKAQRSGKIFLKVDPRNTTQTCACCGYILEDEQKLTLIDREWYCPQCGEYHSRDVNSAMVILQRGMAVCGVS